MSRSLEARFTGYCDRVVSTLMHADREEPARWYIKAPISLRPSPRRLRERRTKRQENYL